MTCLIKRIASGQALYYSKDIGRHYGAPQGGWTSEIRKATLFDYSSAAQAVIDNVIPEVERAVCEITEISTHVARSA